MSAQVFPGERLGTAEEFSSGNGTYERNGYVYSTLVGIPKKRKLDDSSKPPIISVVRKEEKKLALLPEIGLAVTCKVKEEGSVLSFVIGLNTLQVTNINSRMAKVVITQIEDKPLKETFRGIIRREDVRATERDKVEIQKSFRPGDIVKAKVISLGDARSYFLSTAQNEFGVILAESEAGVPMVPISWCQMQCPHTKLKEYRKVAKVN
eukprot:m.15132 g.15132  ORF g.15132 m.15132 type:complete len:208 (+) comp26200_c0_seq1:25-648(+)